MEQDNKYLSSTNGQFDVNNDFMKLPKVNKNDYGDESNDKLSSNGKCENGSKNYDVDDDDDFGPETNVDTVDDAGELSSSNHIIRELFPDDELKEPKIDQDITRNENLQVQDNKIKENNEIIGDADNVAESEDSEDEWNYYRADANNDKKEIELSLENDEKLETNTEIENKSIIEFDNNEKLNDNNDIVDDNLSDKFEYKKEAEQDIEEKEKEVINSSTDSSSSNSSSEDECDKENLPPAKVASTSDNNTNVPQESEEGLEQSSSTLEPIQDEQEEQQRKLQQKQQQELEDMEFQLNPNAAEFIPVSPVPMLPNHLRDTPISGSPLKQTPNMDDIRLPSPEEFNKEARHRPGEIDENTNTIISPTNDNEPSKINSPLSKNIDKSKLIFNLDDSEVSSTIAEFGDESAIDLQKTDLFDGSFTSSSNYTTDMDPMMMSFGPGDFNSLSKKVDLNAVHDLSDTDLMSEHDNETNGGDNNGYCEKEDDHPELKDLISPDNDQPKYTEAFPDHQERDMMFNTSSPSLDNDKQDNFNTIDVLTDEIACMNLANSQQSSDIFSNKETVVEEKDKLTDTVEPNVEGKNNELTRDYCESELNNCKNDLMMSEELKNDDEKSGEIDLMSSKNVQEEQMDLMSSDNLMTPEIIDSSKKSVEPEIGEIGTPIEPVVFKSFDDEKSTIESDEICPVREEIIITEVAVEEPEVAVEETKVVVEEPEVVEKILEVVAETPGAVEQILEIVEETPEAVEKIPEVVVTPEIIEKKIEIEETTEETQDLLVNTNEPEEKLTIKLSESLQEFTGLEKEFIPLEKKLPKDDKIEITTKTNDVKPGVVQKLSASTVPKVDAKSKPSKAQPIKSTTLNKVNKTEVKSTSKISPTSPSKGISSAKSAPSGVVGAKKPLTRPKTADGLSKISTTTTTAAKTTTVSKTSTAIKSPATKPPSTTTTTTTTLKPKTMATTSATRPSTLNTRVSEKKVAAVNGDAKIAPAKPKPASRPLVKPPTTTTAASRPATATSTKPRVPLTQTATKPATSKPIDVKIQRPKTAPVTLGIASKTNRISSTTKSPVIDKQIKETANKQISNRVSTVTKTTTRTIGSTTTTTTTSSSTLAARRLTGVKTTTLNSNIDKKTTATTRISAKSATAAAKSSTTNQQKKAVTKVVKKTEIQNGNCEVKDDNIDVVVQEAIANDNNHLIKDSPALPDTIDNQLIITAD